MLPTRTPPSLAQAAAFGGQATDERGLPVNPAVVDAIGIGNFMNMLGVGKGWEESTAFLDRDPNRPLLGQMTDRLGLLGALLNVTGREIGQPALGAMSMARAKLPGLEYASPLLAPLFQSADPDPAANLARHLAETGKAEEETQWDRDAWREIWNESGETEQVPMSRFALEFLADPSNWIFTRAFAGMLSKGAAELGTRGVMSATRGRVLEPIVTGIGERSLERLSRALTTSMDAQDEALRGIWRGATWLTRPVADPVAAGVKRKIAGIDVTDAMNKIRIPWINELGKEGQFSEYNITLGDIFNNLKRKDQVTKEPRINLEGEMPEIHEPLPDIKKGQTYPSLTRSQGQLTTEEMIDQVTAEMDRYNKTGAAAVRKARAAATDPAAKKAITDFENVDEFFILEQEEWKRLSKTADLLRDMPNSPSMAYASDSVAHTAAELDKLNLEFEQYRFRLDAEKAAGRLDDEAYKKELLRQSADRYAKLVDIDNGLNEALEFAKISNPPKLGPDEQALMAKWLDDMSLYADQIGDFPRTYAQTRAEQAETMLNMMPGTTSWQFDPTKLMSKAREAIELGTAPKMIQKLYDDATSTLPTLPGEPTHLDAAALRFGMMNPQLKGKIVKWFQGQGYPGPLVGTDDFKQLIKDLDVPKVLDDVQLERRTAGIQDRLEQARLDVFNGRLSLGDDMLADVITRGAETPEEMLKMRGANLARLQATLSERLLAREGGGRWEAFVSDDQSQWFRNKGDADQANDLLKQLVQDRRKLYVLVRNASKKLSDTGTPMRDEQILALVREPKTALAWVEDKLSAKKFLEMQAIYNRWQLNPIESDPWTLIGHKMSNTKQQALGINRDRGSGIVGKTLLALKLGDQTLQEEALAAPGTLITNLLGGMMLAATNGGTNPMKVAQVAYHNAQAVFKAKKAGTLAETNYLPAALVDLYEKLGIDAPGTLTAQTKGSLAAQTRRTFPKPGLEGTAERTARTAIEQVHPLIRAGWGAIEGGSIGSPLGPGGMLAGAIAGGLYRVKADPAYKEVAGALYDGVEGALRGTRVLEYWERQTPRLQEYLEDMLTKEIPNRRMKGMRISEEQITGPLAPKTMEQFTDLADTQYLKPEGNPAEAVQEAIDNGGLLSVTDVRRVMMQEGASASDAARVAREWQDELTKVSNAAVEYSNQTNFDYIKSTNLEEFMRKFVWFPTWPIKFAPLFIEMLVQNPQYIWAIARLNDMSERVNKEANRPAGMAGYMGGALASTPLGTMISNMIFGRAGYLAMNVTRPFISQVEGVTSLDQTPGTPSAQFIRAAQGVGFGLRPQFQIPLEILGLANESPFGLARTNQFKEALTLAAISAINTSTPPAFGDIPVAVGSAEAPFTEGKKMLRRALSPVTGATTTEPSVTGSDTKDRLIRLRIAELAYEDNGKEAAGPYRRALTNPNADAQAKQIWDYARRDVEQQMAVQTFVNNVLPVRGRFISDTEQTLRAEQNVADAAVERRRQELVQLVNAGAMSHQAASDELRRSKELARRANPLNEAIWNVGNSTTDTKQRAEDEMRTYSRSIAHLSPTSQRLMIRKFLADRPDIARQLGGRYESDNSRDFREAEMASKRRIG